MAGRKNESSVRVEGNTVISENGQARTEMCFHDVNKRLEKSKKSTDTALRASSWRIATFSTLELWFKESNWQLIMVDTTCSHNADLG